MPLLFRHLIRHYPTANLPGPTNQCAIRLSRALESALPEFYQSLVQRRESRQVLFQGRYFRRAQEIASLLRVHWKLENALPMSPQVFITPNRRSARQARRTILSTQRPGIIFFQNCFNRHPHRNATGENNTPGRAEDRNPHDGNGDHIDLYLGTLPNKRHTRHTYIWDGRADQVWYWPMTI